MPLFKPNIFTQRESLSTLLENLVHIAAENRMPTREEMLQLESMNFLLPEVGAMLGYLSRKWRWQIGSCPPPPGMGEDMLKGFFNIGEKK